jgi:hypothetical protein
MTATIYVSKVAMATMKSIADLSYYDRLTLSDNEATDPTRKEGYFLKSPPHLAVAVIPDGAQVVMELAPSGGGISFPTDLRGCVFEHAPHLPADYANIVHFWSGPPSNSNTGGSAHYQNPAQTYHIDLTPLKENLDLISTWKSAPEIDALLSEGIVVFIEGLGSRVAEASNEDFVSVTLPIDDDLLGLDNGGILASKTYDVASSRAECIVLKVADVRRSPNPDCIYIDALRYEELDYGFYY